MKMTLRAMRTIESLNHIMGRLDRWQRATGPIGLVPERSTRQMDDQSSQAPLQLLTVYEVSQLLRVSRSLVYQLVDTGRIGCHRIGNGRGTIRIAREQLACFLTSSRSTKGPV